MDPVVAAALARAQAEAALLPELPLEEVARLLGAEPAPAVAVVDAVPEPADVPGQQVPAAVPPSADVSLPSLAPPLEAAELTPPSAPPLEAADALPAPAVVVPVTVQPVDDVADWFPGFVPAQAAEGESRVQLGFRDGSTTSLERDSEQAQALEELARLMTSSG